LGRFDGTTFVPTTPLKNAHLGPNFYGALVFVNEPKNRPIMMGWARGSRFPGELFNQCASVPLQMQMKNIQGEDTLCFEPAEEINLLRGKPLLKLTNVSMAEVNAKLQTITSDMALDVTIRVLPRLDSRFDVKIRSLQFHYDGATKILKRADTSRELHVSESLDARFLIDRGIVESFWNQGEAAFCIGSLHTDSGPALAFDGNGLIDEVTVYPMADIWKR
jgi:sucrose-6-phosphate hydrolase SacC (GH32 family)